jgi:putative hemolysin
LLNKLEIVKGDYSLKYTCNGEKLSSIQHLRFEVFNLELGEGLPISHENQLDADEFDEVCVHLYVEHLPSKAIVGTYRMQIGQGALTNIGYYSAREFNLSNL